MAIEGYITRIHTPKNWTSVRDLTIFSFGETIRDGTTTRVRVYSALPDSLIGKPVEFDEQTGRTVMTEDGHTQEYIIQNLLALRDGVVYEVRVERNSRCVGKRVGIVRGSTPRQANDDGLIHVSLEGMTNEHLEPVRLPPLGDTGNEDTIQDLVPFMDKLVNVETFKTFYTRNQIPISVEMTRRFTDMASGRTFEYSWFVD